MKSTPSDEATETAHQSKTRLLQAALRVIRAKGYSATRIDDICEAAELTKGSFFHHFASKEDLALAAAAYWGVTTTDFFADAAYHRPADPVARLLAYIDFRKQILVGEVPEFTCLVGTMVQEVHTTHPAIRDACEESISAHAETLEADIAEAMKQCGIDEPWTPKSLALYTQAVIQGSFILAKAKGDAAVATDCLEHLRRHFVMLFQKPNAVKQTNRTRSKK